MEQQKEQLTTMKGKNKSIQGFLLFLLFFMVIYIWSTLRSNNIEKKGIYSIAYVDRMESTKGGLQVFYHFYYKENIYKSKFTGPFEREEMESKRFYVQFLADKPKKRLVHTDKPVPSCIKKVPFDGWETIPTKCDD